MRLPHAFDLSGRIAVITGGAGLLGVQHAQAIAEAGGTAVIGDVDGEAAKATAEQIAQSTGSRVVDAVLDVTNPESIKELAAMVCRDVGTPDILINNAAVNPKMDDLDGNTGATRFENFSLDEWSMELEVGLTGAFLCCQVFGTEMARRGNGVILNIASDLSLIAPDQRIYRRPDVDPEQQPVKPITYSVVKHGVVGLTRYLAVYWADKGVRVNALSPGGVFAGQPDDFVMRLTNLIPIGRMARADEYKGAIVFLVSDASAYMTGANVIMDGGRTAW